MAGNVRWYIREAGHSDGPLEERQVIERIERGRLGADGLAAREGTREWRRLDAHPAFHKALVTRERGPSRAAATLVGVERAPRRTAGEPETIRSLGGTEPDVLAVPIGRAEPRRWRKPTLGALAMLLPLLGAVGLYVAYQSRDLEPLPLEIASAEVEEVDRSELTGELVEERVRVEVRTEPGARVTVSRDGDEMVVVEQADAEGGATLHYPFERTRAPTVEVRVHAELEERGRRREGHAQVRAERPRRIVVRGSVAECSTRPCALDVEADGTLSTSGVEPDTLVTIGETSATGQAPDPTEDVLRALNPDALFDDGSYTIVLPVRFELSDGTRFEGPVPLTPWTIRRLLFDRFVRVEEGAVEVPVEARGNAILWIGDVGIGRSPVDMRLLGGAEAAGNIGRVALVSTQSRRTTCGRYGPPDNPRVVYVERVHARVTVYDRRRGRVLIRRTILAPTAPCPRTVTMELGTGEILAESSHADPEAIERWLRSL